MLLTIILFLLSVALFLFYIARKWIHSSFDGSNIPGPKAHWFYGNLKEASQDKPLVKLLNEWTQQYGEVYAYYEGSDKNIVISDPDLLQEAFVRQFSTFSGRKRFPFQGDPNKMKRVSMFIAEGERWKKLRTKVNPAFSEVKMRSMYPLIKMSVDQMASMFDKLSLDEGPVDVYEHFKRMTLDVIAECAFGIHLDTQNFPNNQLLNHLKYLFDVQLPKRGWLLVLAQAMPEMSFIIRPLSEILTHLIPRQCRLQLILNDMKNVINQRKNDPSSRRVDILQLLLDAEIEKEDNSDKVKMTKALSIDEIREQAMLFLFAGYETSSTALAYLIFVLAKHPEIQDKLQAEVDDLYEELGTEATESSYERLGTLSYMNNLINETLRYYPIAPSVIARRCAKTIKIGEYTIPEGANIIADVYALHFNPELWGPIDPNIFEPDRFEGNPKRHPAAWVPFGIGPRFCVGQRFAMMEIRAALLRIVRNFDVLACDKTPSQLELKYGPTITPKGELFVTIKPRKLSSNSKADRVL